ncbi:hypothetical protein TRFO_02477 [Tritrichomonas foetus]|uniref:Uncharacterized protein n=1 Tax=Tritrichomonas foetus TaxID=1144522 RepID=A0A1J4L302_9EUKA|nr:hypothetical protein TRFO_02477 [Tritrichomonas foetus]|eukprot:OHT17464.1 hypothetical protein TRFO_02477 [Tritrichomonas foetus]
MDSIISQLSVSYKLSERKIDCVTAFAARVFTKEAAKLIKVIFDSPANTFLNESIIFAFEKLEKNEKLQIVQKENLLTLIIHSFKKSKANGYIAKLAEVLNTELASELQSNAEWSEFTEKVLTPHIEQRNHVEIVKNSSSDDDESDDHDYYGSGIGDNIIDFSDSDSSDDDDEDSDDSDEDSDEEEEKDEDDTNNGQNGSLLLSASDEEDFNTDSTEVKTGITKSNVTSYTENDDSSTDKLNSTLEMEKEFVMTDSEPEEANPNTQNASTNQENDDTPQKVDEKQESQQVESEEK